MKIQDVLWPKERSHADIELYFRSSHIVNIQKVLSRAYVLFDKGQIVTTDTYFNSLSIGKWKKYTELDTVQVTLFVQGRFNINLCLKLETGGAYTEKKLQSATINSMDETDITMNFPPVLEGMLFFQLEALNEEAKFFGGFYATELHSNFINPVKIGIVICTFKREDYIYKNIKQLKEDIIDNEYSPLFGNIDIFIVDNGQTLESSRLEDENICIIANKNTGGTGGFTRGMIEIINSPERKITHVLLMDDDVIIDTASVLRTAAVLMLLKKEYSSAFIGGAMLRMDKPYMQAESGAVWNGGKIEALKSNIDVRKWENCLENEKEDKKVDYAGWWYCCMPVSVICSRNLPMPFFIRRDDIEFGLKNMQEFIRMNGICVWHEPFESKYASYLEYYTVRNQLITNAVHCKWYGRKQVIREMISRCVQEAMLYRYKNAALYMKGVEDFLKGVRWLESQDGQTLHKRIVSMGYQMQPIAMLEESFCINPNKVHQKNCQIKDNIWSKAKRYVTFNGLFLPVYRSSAESEAYIAISQAKSIQAYRKKRILFYNEADNTGFMTNRSFKCFIQCIFKMFLVIGKINCKYKKVKKDYVVNSDMLRTLEFWIQYLGMV